MSVSLKSSVGAIRYDGFNVDDVAEFAGKSNWEVYPDSNSVDGHPCLVVHGVYFMGHYTSDVYEYLKPGDWLVQMAGVLHSFSNDHMKSHFSGMGKDEYEPYATHESDIVTKDVEDAVMPEPSWRAKTAPSPLSDNKFGDPADHAKVQAATEAFDREMKAKGYMYHDKAVDSRTGSTGPSATPGANVQTPYNPEGTGVKEAEEQHYVEEGAGDAWSPVTENPEQLAPTVNLDPTVSATETLSEEAALSPAAKGAAESLVHNRVTMPATNMDPVDPFTTISQKGREISEGKTIEETAPEETVDEVVEEVPEESVPDENPEESTGKSKSSKKSAK